MKAPLRVHVYHFISLVSLAVIVYTLQRHVFVSLIIMSQMTTRHFVLFGADSIDFDMSLWHPNSIVKESQCSVLQRRSVRRGNLVQLLYDNLKSLLDAFHTFVSRNINVVKYGKWRRLGIRFLNFVRTCELEGAARSGV